MADGGGLGPGRGSGTAPGDGGTSTLHAMGLEGFAPYLMNRIMGRYNAGLRVEMRRLGWTTPKMRALAVLSVIDGPTIRELAGFTVSEQSTLSRALDDLAAEGLIRREAHEEDSRSLRVFLTPAGRSRFERFWPTMARAGEAMFRGIGADERAALTATLRKMLANTAAGDDGGTAARSAGPGAAGPQR